LSREEYEDMIAPFIEETLGAVHIALESASLTSSQVDEILLVGGATRTPMIRRRLRECFGKEARGEVDPDLCVTMGASIQGAAIAGMDVSAVLVDVTPYTFGTSALGELNGDFYPYTYVPIIAKNTAIPVRKSEVFFTVVDDQTSVDVRIFQGERDDAMENIQLGEFRVEGLSKAPAGNPIIIDLALDRDGILNVSAKEKHTGLERRITIDRATSHFDKNELRDARHRIAELFDAEDTESSPSPAGLEAKIASDADVTELIAKAQAKLGTAVDEDRAELKALIEMIKDCEERGDATGRNETIAQIRDLLFYLEV
jgi:molecular chaperone DnaK